MDAVLQILAEPDPCSLLGLIAVLCWVGSVMVASRRDLHGWGYRLAAAGFVGYGLYAAFVEQPSDADGYLFIAIRSLFAAGWMLGGSWIVLAVGGFVSDRLKRAFERPPKPLPTYWPDPPRLPAPSPSEVIDVKPEPVKEETFRERVLRSKEEHESRMETIEELQDLAGLDEEMLQELAGKEVERYLRRVSHDLGY